MDDLQLLLLNMFPTANYNKSTFLHLISLPDEVRERRKKRKKDEEKLLDDGQWSKGTVFDN